MIRRVFCHMVLLVALVGATVPSLAGEDASTTDPFPRFEAIEGNVEFWTNVYATWSRGQVAVHDLKYLGVVYEVVDLPGPIEERYTKEQKEFLEDLNESWQDRLRAVEKKLKHGRPLTDREKSWVLAVTTHGGGEAFEGAHDRVRTQRGMRERFRRGLEIGNRYDRRLRQEFRRAGLPEDLAFLPHVESSFQTAAVSSAGAVGAWQFTRATGKRFLIVNSTVDQRLDPLAAAAGAARYLKDAYERLGDWPIALTSYNHGVAGMQRAVNRHGRDYPEIFHNYKGRVFGFASRNFYSEFVAAREIAANPAKYFPEGLELEPPIEVDQVVLESRSTVNRLASAYGIDRGELTRLNPAWSRRALKGHQLPRGLDVWLPPGTLTRIAAAGREPDYEVQAPAVEPGGVYVVKRGDTLSTIAASQRVGLSTLRQLNGIRPGRDLIRVGQKLRLPAGAGGEFHVVARGDTLSTVARRYGVTTGTLRALNGMSAGSDLIRVGQKLRVAGIAPAATRHHVVRKGETLSTIARAYRMTLDVLRALNGIAPGNDLIRAGQKLLVHGPLAATVHVVRRGESLSRIASSYGVKLADLLRHNRLSLRSVIHPGQALRIPGR